MSNVDVMNGGYQGPRGGLRPAVPVAFLFVSCCLVFKLSRSSSPSLPPEPHLGDLRKTTDEAASAESVACCRGPDAMGIYTPDGSCYELLTMIGEKPAPRSASGPDPNVGLSHR
ncbi:hypothetical protein FKM82_025587 [Ascaphus truei]